MARICLGRHEGDNLVNDTLGGSVITFQSSMEGKGLHATSTVNNPGLVHGASAQSIQRMEALSESPKTDGISTDLRPERVAFSIETLDKWAATAYETASNEELRSICLYRDIPVLKRGVSRSEMLKQIEDWDAINYMLFEETNYSKKKHLNPLSDLNECELPWFRNGALDGPDGASMSPDDLPPGFYCTKECVCGRILIRTTKLHFFRRWSTVFLVMKKNTIEVYRSRRAWELGNESSMKVYVDPLLEISPVLPHGPWKLGGSWKANPIHMFKLLRESPKAIPLRSKPYPREFTLPARKRKDYDFIPAPETVFKFGLDSVTSLKQVAELMKKWIQYQPANATCNNLGHDPWTMAKGYSPFVA